MVPIQIDESNKLLKQNSQTQNRHANGCGDHFSGQEILAARLGTVPNFLLIGQSFEGNLRDNKISLQTYPGTGLVVRENINLNHGREHETPVDKPERGTGDDEVEAVFDGIDCPLKIAEILERFKAHPTIRMRPEGTVRQYSSHFKRFAKAVRLEDYTRKQMAGAKGKKLILEHIANLRKMSRRTHYFGIRKVWTFALNLPWPIDMDRDIGDLPTSDGRDTPKDWKVKLWNDKMEHEPSIYLRCLWLLTIESGNRPGTLSKLDWRHVRYDEHGLPCEIRMDGGKEGLKTFAKVAWRLPPNVSTALVELRKFLGEPNDNTPVFPLLTGWGTIDSRDRMPQPKITDWFHRLAKKYGLPDLTPVFFRHWVDSQCVDENLREEARCYMMGHGLPGGMRARYDRRGPEFNMIEQARVFPNGLLAKFSSVNAEIAPEIPCEVVKSLFSYRNGMLKSTEMLDILETWRIDSRLEEQKIDR